ncbi:MAG TPA: FAD-dependent monooxygenase [Casimicrobiaceae bacterium]|nr:FAD-dependent monooxygenase [Casimicrobiaceae bacterium]
MAVTNPLLVVGAGPVGLTLAMELARYRMPVRIVDETPARTDKSKALAVWPRTLELLDRSGAGEAFVAAGIRAHAMNVMSAREKLARIAFDHVDSAYAFALMLPQSETERLLEARLAQAGLHVERSTGLTGFAQSGDYVSCTLRRADGSTETLATPYLLACDGARSTVRQSLGLAFEGETLGQRFVLADLHVAGLGLPGDELATFLHRDGLLVFFPIAGNRYRVIGDLGRWNPADRTDPTLADVQALVDARGPGGVTLSDPLWLSSFGVNERKVAHYRHGRIFLAGDAAHIHSPAGGQGMNTGMQDAFNLAWKLALAVAAARAAERLLDSYSAERSPIAAQVLADSGRLLRIATASNALVQDVRNFMLHHVLGLAPVQHAMVDRLTEVAVEYPHSPLNAGSANGLKGPGPGQRIVAGQPFGGGDGPRFALAARPGDGVASLMRDHPSLLDPELREPPDPAGAWLVRPDGYVAAVAPRNEMRRIADYLADLGSSAPTSPPPS